MASSLLDKEETGLTQVNEKIYTLSHIIAAANVSLGLFSKWSKQHSTASCYRRKKSIRKTLVYMTLADVWLWSEQWNFSSVGTGISSQPETDGLTSGRHTETKSGEEENTTAEQRALEGKLRITSPSTWAEVDGFEPGPATHTHTQRRHLNTSTGSHEPNTQKYPMNE